MAKVFKKETFLITKNLVDWMGKWIDLFLEIYGLKRYGKKVRTEKGEKVKSMAEKKIADYLNEKGIRYQYEKTMTTFPLIGKKISTPDFYLPDHDVWIEYWGLIEAKDKSKRDEYQRAMQWKMNEYKKYKIRLISLYSNDLWDLDEAIGTKFKEATG